MKYTYPNKEQLIGAVNTLIAQYSDNVRTISDERDLIAAVIDCGSKWKVELHYVSEIIRKPYPFEDTVKYTDDFFYLVKEGEANNVKLEKELTDLLDKISESQVIAA